jgi:hypothetical protein
VTSKTFDPIRAPIQPTFGRSTYEVARSSHDDLHESMLGVLVVSCPVLYNYIIKNGNTASPGCRISSRNASRATSRLAFRSSALSFHGMRTKCFHVRFPHPLYSGISGWLAESSNPDPRKKLGGISRASGGSCGSVKDSGARYVRIGCPQIVVILIVCALVL